MPHTHPVTTDHRPNRTPTFDEDQENSHRIEFEVPLSGDSELYRLQREQGQGRFSIDFSLELERQLAMESPPITPGHDATTHQDTTSTHSQKRSESHLNDLLPDPEVLANIVMQLRHSLTETTKERDELVKLLASANTEEANAKDALQVMTDLATEAEEELTALRKKAREQEEQIALLRTKVEESRRGLMRLQTENRRQSMVPIDVSRASAATLTSFTGSASSKRSSFVPLTGTMHGKPGHRRGGSVVDSALSTPTFGSSLSPDSTPSPHARAFNIASAEAALSGASTSHRHSGIFGRQLSTDDDHSHLAAAAEWSAANSAELEALRKEIQTLKLNLDNAEHDLQEANEAKEASETCVTALREFIAENNVGATGSTTAVKPLPPPMTSTGEETATDPRKTGSGWGFKLWGNGSVDSPPRPSIESAAPYSPSVAQSSPVPTPTVVDPPVKIGAAPLSRKLGSFFSSRSSISSNHSREQVPLPQLQTNAAATQVNSQRDSVYSHSDASSVAEPISPGSDINGLGTVPFHIAGQIGKDITNLDGTPIHISVSAADVEPLR